MNVDSQVRPAPSDKVYDTPPPRPAYIDLIYIGINLLALAAWIVSAIWDRETWSIALFGVAVMAVIYSAIWSDRQTAKWNATWRWYQSFVLTVETGLMNFQQANSGASHQSGTVALHLMSGHVLDSVTPPDSVLNQYPVVITYKARLVDGEWKYRFVSVRDNAEFAAADSPA